MTITYYKIEDKTDPSIFYIGSTKHTLRKRICNHKLAIKQFKNRKLYDYILQKENLLDDFNIIDLQETLEEGENRFEKEQKLINLYQPPLNINRAFLTPEDSYKLHLMYWKRRNHTIVNCECGCTLKKGGIWKHRKSQKHKKLLFNKCLTELLEKNKISCNNI